MGGITIASNTDNILDYLTIENAGGTSTGFNSAINNGAIRLICSGSRPASITVSNTQIINSSSWGIYRDAPGCTVNIDDTVLFTDNSLGSINNNNTTLITKDDFITPFDHLPNPVFDPGLQFLLRGALVWPRAI